MSQSTQTPRWGPPLTPQPPKPKRRIPVIGWIGIGIVVLVILGIIATVTSSENKTASPATTISTPATTAPPQVTEPAAPAPADVVRDYFAALNARDWQRAWDLGGASLGGEHHAASFGAFLASFHNVKRFALTIRGVSGTSVDITYIETATNGTKTTYSGSYIVEQGKITNAGLAKVATATTARPRPKPTVTTRAPAPKTTAAPATDPRFGTCREAIANGYGPYTRGQNPEYYWYIDRDHDGIVCER